MVEGRVLAQEKFYFRIFPTVSGLDCQICIVKDFVLFIGLYASTEPAIVTTLQQLCYWVCCGVVVCLFKKIGYAGRCGIEYSSVPFIDQSDVVYEVEISREVVSIGICMIGDDGST